MTMSTDIAHAAVELLNRQGASESQALARDARDLANALHQFADDVEAGLATGRHSRVAQDMTQFLIRAATLKAQTETAQIFSATEQ